jgi:hypothetical protein
LSSTASRQLEIDGSVLSLEVKIKKEVSEPVRLFSVQSGSEFVSPEAQILQNFGLKMARVITNSNDFSMLNYPNPFHNFTNIVYSLPVYGEVRLVISNIVGKQVCALVNGNEENGTHTISFNPAQHGLTPGVYFCVIEVNSGTEHYTKTIKLVYTK